MNKGILVYVAILVILAIVAYVLLTSHGGTGKPSSTTTVSGGKGSTVSTASTTISTKKTTAGSTTIAPTTVNFTNCVSNQTSQEVYNGNFSTGTYAGWNVTGPAFGTAPFNLTYANMQGIYYNSTWSNYNGSYVATTFTGGTTRQEGNLTSDPILIDEPYLNFKVISPQYNNLYVEVLSANGSWVAARFNTFNTSVNPDPNSRFLNGSILVVSLLCQDARIRIVSGIAGSGTIKYDYIAAGDFYLAKKQVLDRGILINQTIS